MHKVIIINLFNWVRVHVNELGDMNEREIEAEGIQLSDYLHFLSLRITLRNICA